MKRIVSLVLIFLTLFNFVGYVKVQAFAISTSVGLLVFGTLLVASGIYVSSKTDTQILYDTFLTTVDSLGLYNEWARMKFGAALGVGKWAFEKTEPYVEHFVDVISSKFVEMKEYFGHLVLGPETLECLEVPVLGATGYLNFSDYFDVEYTYDSNLSVDFIFNDHLYNLYFLFSKYEGYEGLYRYQVFINGKFLGYTTSFKKESPYGLWLGSGGSLRMWGHGDWIEVKGSLYSGGVRNTIGFDIRGEHIKSIYDTPDLDYPTIPVHLNDDNIIDNPDIELGVNNPTMPLVNVDEFGAYYDDTTGQYVFEGDIDSLVDTLENTGQLDNVLDRTLGLQKEGVDSLPNVRVNEGEGVVTWDKVGELDTSVPDVVNPDIPSVWERLFVPSEVDLDFSPLMDISITDKFPFCIPFDFYHSIEAFASEAKEPSFVIDLETSFFDVYHEVDLSPFIFYISFFRYVVVAWFLYILLSKTRDFIKW